MIIFVTGFDIKYHQPHHFLTSRTSLVKIDVSFKEEPFEVEWLFDKEVSADAKRYIFHPTQTKIENPDGTLTIKFQAGGSLEMDWHLYTWSNHVKVIKPKDWYKKIRCLS